MSLQHIQKNSPRLLPKPAKFEKNPPNGYRVIRKTKCGAGGARSSPIHKQASLAGRLKMETSHRLKQAKSIPEDRKIQDGDPRISENILEYRGMGDINRPTRRLPPYSNSPKIRKYLLFAHRSQIYHSPLFHSG